MTATPTDKPKISKQAAALVHHFQETAARVVVFLVGLEVFGKVFDAGGQQGDLDFRGAGIVGGTFVFADDFAGINGHINSL